MSKSSANTTETPTSDGLLKLQGLGFSSDDLQLLRRQGYVEQRPRPGGHGYWRLRFRRPSGMITIYLGADRKHVQEVQDELTKLQAPHRRRQQLAQLVRRSKKDLREAKRRLTPALAEHGYHYHGDTIRKIRTPPQIVAN